MTVKYRVKTLRKTCDSCPAQWEGRLDDERLIYIRYRYGFLRVGIADDLDASIQRAMNDPDIYIERRDSFEGVMDLNELKSLLPNFILPDTD